MPPARPYRGVLFDKDGTLIDFEATWRGFVDEVLDALAPGDPALRGRLAEVAGIDADGRFRPGSPIVAGSTAEVATLWAPLLPGWTVETLEREADRRAREAAGRGPAPATRDIAGLLDRLRARKLTLGVATHDSEGAAHAHLAALGVADRFGFVAGYDSGHGLKPGPGMVLAFCAAAGCDPAETVMVGDSVHDLGAGRAAGVGLVVGVLTGPAREADLAPLADVVAPSIAALPDLLDR